MKNAEGLRICADFAGPGRLTQALASSTGIEMSLPEPRAIVWRRENENVQWLGRANRHQFRRVSVALPLAESIAERASYANHRAWETLTVNYR